MDRGEGGGCWQQKRKFTARKGVEPLEILAKVAKKAGGEGLHRKPHNNTRARTSVIRPEQNVGWGYNLTGLPGEGQDY